MNVEQRTERPRGAVRIDQVADLITPMAVRVAATLRLADHIDAGATSIEALAEVTATDAGGLTALVRHLETVDVLARGPGGALELTRLGKQLRVAQEFLDAETSVGRSELCLVQLLESVRTGRAAYPAHFGTTFWDDLIARPQMKASFDSMTDRHLDREFVPLLAAYDWAGAGHVSDLGAGNGDLLVRLLSTYPDLTGTILDLPGNTGPARENLAGHGLAGRSTVLEGSFFEPLDQLPTGTVVLSSVLHDWDDAETGRILRRVADRLRPDDGTLLIIDSFVENDSQDTTMNLRMLALFGGRQRTVADMAAVAAGAGLELVRAQRLRVKWLLELKPGPADFSC